MKDVMRVMGKGGVSMRRPIVLVRNLLLLLLLLFLAGSVFAGDGVGVPRVWNTSPLELGVDEWRKLGAQVYTVTLQEEVGVQVYAVYDEKDLYLGFYVADPYLTFVDDYSKNFTGSDHLRVYLKVDQWRGKDDLILYLLPTSKIKEPLLRISGLSWQRKAFKVKSVIMPEAYFLKLAVSLQELELLALPEEKIRLNCQINSVSKNGVSTIWLVGEKDTDGLVLTLE
jgi:hypothetical protein